MSATATGIELRAGHAAHPLPRADVVAPARPWVRLAAFAALAGYGVVRWATLVRPAPGWRLVGLLAIAVLLAGGIPLIARRDRVVAPLTAFLVMLIAFPVAGLPWQWFIHLRVAVSAGEIGSGLAELPGVLVPYLGGQADVRLVITLGAAVLLLDAAMVLAFADPDGPRLGDGRRAAAALPLIALAVVPSTLLRPQLPYLQGLLLFVLLAAFLWGERLRRQTAQAGLALVLITGAAAAVVAPRLDGHHAWVDYRAWAGSLPRRVDRFDWNQTYGPLRWPHNGHEVMTVRARTGEYWKAQDLDLFNGYAWVSSPTPEPPLPSPKPSALARWTQVIRVTVQGMSTREVVAAGTAAQPSAIPGGVGPGVDAGTWVAGRALGPGTTYRVLTYSPRPSPRQLARAGRRYPASALAAFLTLNIPVTGVPAREWPQVQLPAFGSSASPRAVPAVAARGATLLARSPYARAYDLARRLAAGAKTPYAYVERVLYHLRHGFTYDQNPTRHAYPLESFLFTTRDGYCQQFSGAMALLLRMGGIPARVAAGFTTGTYDATAHRWVVTDTDAHAWVEAWFPGYGWVRFDPTPLSAPARGSAASPILKPNGAGPAQSAVTARRQSPGGATASTAPPPATGGAGAGAWPIAAVAAAVAAGLAALLWLGLRRRPLAPEGLVDELERALARTRRPLVAGATLAGLEQRLHSAPGAAAYVRALRLARYGGAGSVPTAADRRALRAELARGLGVAGRLRALWALPPRPHSRRPQTRGTRGS